MNVISVNIHIWQLRAEPAMGSPFKMKVQINSVPLNHERINREYSSAGDCITSARHLVNEVTKGQVAA